MGLAESSLDVARDSFDRAPDFMDLLPAGVLLVEGDCPANARVLRWNRACARLLGASPEAGTSPSELPAAFYRPDRTRPLPRSDAPPMRAIASGEPVHEPELHLRRPDGEWRVLSVSAAPILRDGRVEGALAVLQDVTAARSADGGLRRDEGGFARLAGAVPAVLYEYEGNPDGGGRFTYLSPGCRELFEVEAHEIVRDIEIPRGMAQPEDVRAIQAASTAASATAAEHGGEVRIRTPSGRQKWIQFLSHPSPARPGEPETRFGLILDVTERKRTEEALRESEEWLKLTVEASGAGIFHCVPYGPLWWSDRCREMFGVPEDYVIRGPEDHLRLVHPDDRERVRTAVDRGLDPSGDGLCDVQYRCVRPDGTVRWIAAKLKILFAEVDGERRAVRLAGANLDITDRKREEEALRDSEARFRTLADEIPQHAFMADGRGQVFWLNRRAQGFSGETSLGYGYLQILHPDHRDRVAARVRRALETGETIEDTFPLLGVEGRYRWFLCRVVPLRDEAGRVVRWFGTNTDVTDQRAADEALRESEARGRAILASLAEGVVFFDADGVASSANQAALDLVGLSAQELPARSQLAPGWGAIRSDGTPLAADEYPSAVALRTGRPQRDVELGIRRRDRSLVWLSVNAEPVWLSRDRMAGVVVSLFDVTQRREALQKSEGRLRNMADSLPDEIFRLDRQLRILFANEAVAAAMGVSVDQLVGKTPVELGRASGHGAFLERQLLEALRTASSGRFEFSLPGPEGRHCESRVIPERDGAGAVESVLLITRDITDRKRAERQLLASREQLRALVAGLNSVREEEKARLSRELHDEMGQLLTALRMELEALEDGLGDPGMPGAVRGLLDRAVAASDLVARTIDSMRNILSSLRPVALDRLGLCAAVRQECRRFEDRVGVACEFAAADDLATFEPEVDTALFRIAQEALTNVARHAGASRVSVVIERRAGAAVLRVADDGNGIQAGRESAGLGLLGMRERAERLGGQLAVKTSPRDGTMVEARIPLRANGDVAS